MVWRLATLPMSCYIVQKTTTRRMPQSYACYLMDVAAARGAVISRFHGVVRCSISVNESLNLWV